MGINNGLVRKAYIQQKLLKIMNDQFEVNTMPADINTSEVMQLNSYTLELTFNIQKGIRQLRSDFKTIDILNVILKKYTSFLETKNLREEKDEFEIKVLLEYVMSLEKEFTKWGD